MLLTKSDICEITGLTHDQFEAWCRQGVIQSVNAGRGRGNHRRFDIVQATALLYSFQWKRCGASSFSPSFVTLVRCNPSVVSFLSAASSFTPPSVTFGQSSSSVVRFVSRANSFSPASVTWLSYSLRSVSFLSAQFL